MIVFRVGATDAEAFEKEFAPVFTLDDIVNLSAYQIYLRLMIDGQGSKPFSARTLNQIAKPPHSSAQVIITHSRTHYGKQKFLVEEEIMEFYKPVNKVEKKKEFSDERGERTIEVNVGDRNTVVHERPPVKREWERRDPPKERREYKSEERSIPPVREDRDRFNTNQQPKKPQYPPREAREQREYREHKDTKEQKPQSFDERPAKSLKEALEEAMRAQKEVRKEDVSHDKGNQTSAHPTPSEPTPSPKKEIDEKVLRSLLEE
jgi:Mg-chelatase subunit ChlI